MVACMSFELYWLKFHSHFMADEVVSLKLYKTGAPQLLVLPAINPCRLGISFATIFLVTESLQEPKVFFNSMVCAPAIEKL